MENPLFLRFLFSKTAKDHQTIRLIQDNLTHEDAASHILAQLKSTQGKAEEPQFWIDGLDEEIEVPIAHITASIYSGTAARQFPDNYSEMTTTKGHAVTLLSFDVTWKAAKTDDQAAKDQAKPKRKAGDSAFTTAMHEKVDRLLAQDITGMFYPAPGLKAVKHQPEDAAKFWGAAFEAVKASLDKVFPSMGMKNIDSSIKGYIHSSRNLLASGKASEALKQDRANKGKLWNDRFKPYQDSGTVPAVGAEFEVYAPKGRVLGTTKAPAASAAAAATPGSVRRGAPTFTPSSVPPQTMSGAAVQQHQQAPAVQRQQAAAAQQQQPAAVQLQQAAAAQQQQQAAAAQQQRAAAVQQQQQQQGDAEFRDMFGDDNLANHEQRAARILMHAGDVTAASTLLAQIAASKQQPEQQQQKLEAQGLTVLAAVVAAAEKALNQEKPKKKKPPGKKRGGGEAAMLSAGSKAASKPFKKHRITKTDVAAAAVPGTGRSSKGRECKPSKKAAAAAEEDDLTDDEEEAEDGNSSSESGVEDDGSSDDDSDADEAAPMRRRRR